MLHYKDTNNNPFAFEDNVTPEIIAKVETTHKITLTKITLAEYKALIAPTFTQLRTAKKQEIYGAYNNANQLDIAYMTTTFQADKKSQDLIVSVLSAGSVPTGFFWLDKTNNQVAMTYAQLQGLSGAILSRGQTNFAKLQGLKAKAKLAKTQTALKKVVW